MVPENGSTELWPGTHRVLETAEFHNGWYHEQDGPERGLLEGQDWVRDPAVSAQFAALVDQRRREAPPVQLVVPKGAVSIRDNRCWHAGQPNHTDVPRHMFGLGYATSRDTTPDRFMADQNGKPHLLFSEDCKAAFVSDVSLRTVSFAPSIVDHFGNVPDDTEVFPGGRKTFWMPHGPVPTPTADSPAAKQGWIKTVASGLKLVRPGDGMPRTAAL